MNPEKNLSVRVWGYGFGFGVWSLGFGVWGLGFGFGPVALAVLTIKHRPKQFLVVAVRGQHTYRVSVVRVRVIVMVTRLGLPRSGLPKVRVTEVRVRVRAYPRLH